MKTEMKYRIGHGVRKARQAVFARFGLVLLIPLLGGAGGGPSPAQNAAAASGTQQDVGSARVYFATEGEEAPEEGRVSARNHWTEFAFGDVLLEARRLAGQADAEEPAPAPNQRTGFTFGDLFFGTQGAGGVSTGNQWAGFAFGNFLIGAQDSTGQADDTSEAACNETRRGSAKCPGADDALFLEACNENRCYSAVVTMNLLQAAEQHEALEVLYLSALSTAIANELAELPEASVGERLKQMATQLLSEPTDEQDYATLLSLDLHNNPEHLTQIARPALLAAAETQIASDTAPTISDLIATAGLQTQELFASESFVFSNSRELEIDVDISARRTAPTFLSVCGDFTHRDGKYQVNYADCQLKAPLQRGRYTGSLRITGGLEQLLVTLMPLENPNAVEHIERSLSHRESVLTVR